MASAGWGSALEWVPLAVYCPFTTCRRAVPYSACELSELSALSGLSGLSGLSELSSCQRSLISPSLPTNREASAAVSLVSAAGMYNRFRRPGDKSRNSAEEVLLACVVRLSSTLPANRTCPGSLLLLFSAF